MSDDLKQNLRGSCYLAFEDGTNDYETAPEAADRIEELEGQLKTVLDRETSILRYYDAKLDAAEDKLAKSVEALEGWINVYAHCTIEVGVCCCGDDMNDHQLAMDSNHMPLDHGAYIAGELAKQTETTLAELKGDKL